MESNKQHQQIVVYIKDIKEWLEEKEIDEKAQHLVFAPSNMLLQINCSMADKLMRYKSIEHLTLEGCEIGRLEGLPKLPFLLWLDLKNNRYGLLAM